MQSDKRSNDSLLSDLAGGDMTILDDIYKKYRDDFLRWSASRFSGFQWDDLLDAWHDTIIMFYEQVRDRKLTRLTCELKTFLFLIGYRRLLVMHRKSGRTIMVDQADANVLREENIYVIEWEECDQEKRALLLSAVDELPEQGRKILMQRYVEGKTMTAIMQAMGYTSVNAVRVTLSRSMKRLKEIIAEKMEQQPVWKKEI